MYSMRVDHVNKVFFELYDYIRKNGHTKNCRGREAREILNYSLEIMNPSNGIVHLIKRKASYPLIAAEFLMYVVGWGEDPRHAQFLIDVMPGYKRFLNEETGIFDGAYGPHIGEGIERVLLEFQKDPNTRQAYIPIYTIEDLHNANLGSSKDIPCTVGLHFQSQERNGIRYLHMITTMRSNDLLWGMCHDIAAFTMIQVMIARLLGYALGSYHHNVFNMHYYTDTVRDIETQYDSYPEPSSIYKPIFGTLEFSGEVSFIDKLRETAELSAEYFDIIRRNRPSDPEGQRNLYDDKIRKLGTTPYTLWLYLTNRARRD